MILNKASAFQALVCVLALGQFAQCLPIASNKYYYMLAREKLRNMESNSQKFLSLSARETIVHFYLESLKQQEYAETSTRFLPSLPIEEVRDEMMRRQLYQLLRALPKGGNLHMHEPEMLDRKVFLELIENDPELYEMLYICDKANELMCALKKKCDCSKYQLRYFAKNPDDGWSKVKGKWSIDAILNVTTLIGIFSNLDEKLLPTDSNGRWRVANKAGDFTFYDPLLNHNKTRFMYMKACLDSSLEEGVQIVEFRRANFGTLFYFDSNGQEVIIKAADEINMLTQFKKQYIKENPKFIDFTFIIYGIRRFTKEEVLLDMRLAIETQKQFPEIIRGYDLVGEEDLGHTLLFHSDSLIEAVNYMVNGSSGTFSLNFHVGETNWPDDYKPVLDGDDVNTINNIYDALLMRTHRIGHGLGFIKHPELYPFIKQNEIAIEVCPTSNQILGFVPDLRSHQALNYYRSGIPIVIAGDDPGSFGYNELTVDYYQVFMAWGLNLADLKEIANNSIKYSTIPDDIKLVGYKKFQTEWDYFIDFMYVRACSVDTNLTKIELRDMQPNFGPNDRSNKISFFGYGFDQGYCKNITCNFGRASKAYRTGVTTNCRMKTLNEIECDTPEGFQPDRTLPVSLLFNQDIVLTKFNYTFLSSSYFSKENFKVTNTERETKPIKETSFFRSMYSFVSDVVDLTKSKILSNLKS